MSQTIFIGCDAIVHTMEGMRDRGLLTEGQFQQALNRLQNMTPEQRQTQVNLR